MSARAEADAPHVVVLGAGLAGLICALELAWRGLAVTVVEAGPRAGGRTCSWRDAGGRPTDTGLHVVTDHYHNLLDVLARVGATGRLRWWDEHYHLRKGKTPQRARFAAMPAPFHALPAIAMPLSATEWWRGGRALYDAARRSQADLVALDDVTYAAWHDGHRLGRGVLWDTAEMGADAATFLPPEQASARAVLSWIKYMARDAHASRVGTWTGPLSECLVAPLLAALEAAGGTVRCDTAVTGFLRDGASLAGVRVQGADHGRPVYTADGAVRLTDGSDATLAADHVVSCLPVQALQHILPMDLAADAGLLDVFELSTVPAISVSLCLDREISPAPPGAPVVTGASMRDFIDLSTLWREPPEAPGSVYQCVVAKAERYVDASDEDLAKAVYQDLRAVWPAARFARLADAVVERIPAAMFAAVPGAHRRRPAQSTAVPNLWLAGDWTRHLRNASMEGAATSARLAARALLQSLGRRGPRVHPAPEGRAWLPGVGTRRSYG